MAGAITRFFPEDVLLKYLGWYSRPLALPVLATALSALAPSYLKPSDVILIFLESMEKSYLYLLCIPGFLFLMCSLGGKWSVWDRILVKTILKSPWPKVVSLTGPPSCSQSFTAEHIRYQITKP